MSFSDKVIGNISETLNEGEFEWRINFCSAKVLEIRNGDYLASPVFSFSSSSWYVRIYPNGFDSSCEEWVTLFLHKKETLPPVSKHVKVSFAMTLRDAQLAKVAGSSTFLTEVGRGWKRFISRQLLIDHCSLERGCSQLIIKISLTDPVFPDQEDPLLKVRMKGKEILCQNYKDMLLDGKDHDVIFKVKDKEFKAHRIILHFRCPVFKSMLSCEMLEKNRGIVEIDDCDPVAFEQFLFYIYTSELSTSDESTILGLYFIADKYDMKNLKEECSTFIKKSLSIDVVCSVIELALNHNDSSLLEFATEFFVNNAKKIFLTKEWQFFMKENPVQGNELMAKAFDKNSHCFVHSSTDGLSNLEKKNNKILRQSYKDLLLCGEDHDLILKVKDKEFKAHRLIMQCRCPVFKSMLTHEMLEKDRGVVEIPDCDPSAFEQFLFYVYSGDLETLDESIMLDLYYIADKYDMSDLKEKCCEFFKMSLTTQNVSDVMRLATNHCNASLLEFAMKFFVKNVKEILVTVEWQTFMKDNPIQANELFIKTINNVPSYLEEENNLKIIYP